MTDKNRLSYLFVEGLSKTTHKSELGDTISVEEAKSGCIRGKDKMCKFYRRCKLGEDQVECKPGEEGCEPLIDRRGKKQFTPRRSRWGR